MLDERLFKEEAVGNSGNVILRQTTGLQSMADGWWLVVDVVVDVCARAPQPESEI